MRLCGRSRALEIVCSAEDYDADTGELFGFVNRSLPDAELDAFVDAFATRIAGFDRKVLAACKKTINERADLPSLGELLASNHQLYEVDYNWPKPEGAFEQVMAAGLGQKGDFELNLPYAINTLGQKRGAGEGMNICVLSGSPHKHGNTMQLVERSTAGAKASGHEVTLFDTVRMDIHPCMGCMACKKKSEGCIQQDDMEEIYPAVRAADVLVFATPMYWWNVSGPPKTAIDRLFALPFTIRRGGHALEGKRLQMLLTCGQPASRELQTELESMGRKMCAFTDMEWLGILAGAIRAKRRLRMTLPCWKAPSGPGLP